MRLEFQWRHYVCHCGVRMINAADITFIVLVHKNYALTLSVYKLPNTKDKGRVQRRRIDACISYFIWQFWTSLPVLGTMYVQNIIWAIMGISPSLPLRSLKVSLLFFILHVSPSPWLCQYLFTRTEIGKKENMETIWSRSQHVISQAGSRLSAWVASWLVWQWRVKLNSSIITHWLNICRRVRHVPVGCFYWAGRK